MWSRMWSFTCTIVLLALSQCGYALFDQPFISFKNAPSALTLTHPDIVIDADDFTGVHIAANSLAQDIQSVTGSKSTVYTRNTTSLEYHGNSQSAIIVGTTGSSLIQELVAASKFNVSSVEGKWESFVTGVVDAPFAGLQRALVIAGSDKRGATYGIYTLSEQMGVSPWYWWADVEIPHQSTIYALDVETAQGEPSVKYRGLFLNDESPALTNWVIEKFGPKYNVEFYKHIFELLLRLKANYLWPAMWPSYPEPGNSFFVDDPLNQKTADEYGIVVSTSHQEPMQRATNEWLTSGNGTWDWTLNKDNVTRFFTDGIARAKPYESYITLGMRGAGDSGVVGSDPMAILRDVIDTERRLIGEEFGAPDNVTQVWALYKEVQALYEAGLEIPDDVTLLFSDDNFGNVRRLPTESEKARKGGIGIYYHLEYVGTPRSYKWLNTNSLGKAQQQLSAAYEHGIDRIWIINVADLKPMETPLSMIMAMAWNISSVTANTIPNFLQTYSDRDFASAPAATRQEIADLLLSYSELMGLRRHEHVETSTYSILNYNEADRFLERWSNLTSRAEAVSKTLPSSSQPSFFQLVLQPIKASYIFFSLKIAQAKNTQYATQRRNSANDYANLALELFGQDFDLQEEYHSLLNGKWDHMMAQSHYGFVSGSWIPPSRDMISGLSYVQLRQNTIPALGQVGVAVDGNAGRAGFNEGSDFSKPSRGELLAGVTLPPMDPYGPKTRWFEVFARGAQSVDWSLRPEQPWVKLSSTKGKLAKGSWDKRITVEIDWDTVPAGFNATTLIHMNSTAGDSFELIRLPIQKVQVPTSFNGFVESDRHVSIDAVHFTAKSDGKGLNYEVIPHLGRLLPQVGSIALTPSTATVPKIPDGPWLEYSVYLFSSLANMTISLYITTTVDQVPDLINTFALSLDGSSLAVTRLSPEPKNPGDLPDGWTDATQDLVWRKDIVFQNVKSGEHKLRYWAGTTSVVLEKLVLNLGGVRPSYLGPPESARVGSSK